MKKLTVEEANLIDEMTNKLKLPLAVANEYEVFDAEQDENISIEEALDWIDQALVGVEDNFTSQQLLDFTILEVKYEMPIWLFCIEVGIIHNPKGASFDEQDWECKNDICCLDYKEAYKQIKIYSEDCFDLADDNTYYIELYRVNRKLDDNELKEILEFQTTDTSSDKTNPIRRIIISNGD